MRQFLSGLKLRKQVFYPPFLLLLGAALFSFLLPEQFLSLTENLNSLLLRSFGKGFMLATALFF
ncbi:MAG: hypothetical protein ACPF8V_08335, partial [Luteibaculum sp.]